MTPGGRYLLIALATPLRRLFTYLPPADPDTAGTALQPGQRVIVPFGSRRRVGSIMGHSNEAVVDAGRLKRISSVIDEQSILPDSHLALLRWASDYYQHPVGEAVFTSLPARLRQGAPAILDVPRGWQFNPDGPAVDMPRPGARAPRQAELLALFENRYPATLTATDIAAAGIGNWRAPLKALAERGWVREVALNDRYRESPPLEQPLTLNRYQQQALAAIRDSFGRHRAHLLEGVTGSGKTEVYLQATAAVLEQGRQCLLLLPEIALTPQLVRRFERRFGPRLAILHSGLTDTDRCQAWLRARDGSADVVLGTRSAVWTPLKNPGLIIVDEEHDLSYKQQDGFRYHARDVAIMRAYRESIPIVLGSATPSLESLLNAGQGRYEYLPLPERAGTAKSPDLHVLDIRQSPMRGALSEGFLKMLDDNLAAGRQSLLFLNRRGFAPVLLCHECGWTATCHRCDTAMTYHKQRQRLCCHHCGHEHRRPDTCPGCGGKLIEVGHGTERLEQTLAEALPAARILRIDRDSTRRRGALEDLLRSAHSGEADILVGTQMLAKGHHFPSVSLVGIVEADGGLFSTDFRALEHLAQLIVQVSGRAGRAEHPGTVVIQTHHPDHPLLRTLTEDGYPAFAKAALAEREMLQLPPYSYLALMRAEAKQSAAAERFLQEARQLIPDTADVEVLGPVPAPRPRRSGYQRLQLLLQSPQRPRLQRILGGWLDGVEQLKSARHVRWSIDVDPQEMG
ncbi:MAG: primosomal protein N' [Gammaproteobacteria bacterium]|nr:primosomal protein N' [Gammaproteobacteria bacterium]